MAQRGCRRRLLPERPCCKRTHPSASKGCDRAVVFPFEQEDVLVLESVGDSQARKASTYYYGVKGFWVGCGHGSSDAEGGGRGILVRHMIPFGVALPGEVGTADRMDIQSVAVTPLDYPRASEGAAHRL